MIQISQEDRSHYKKVLAEIKQLKPTTYRRRDFADAEDLKTLHRLYRKGEPFMITGVVVAPYGGCFSEPQIWLVTPPDCEKFEELNKTWRPRFADSKGRQAALAKLDKLGGDLWKAKWDIEWEIRPFLEEIGGMKGIKVTLENSEGDMSADNISRIMDEVKLCLELKQLIEEEVEPLIQAENIEAREEILKRFPPLPEPPPSIVWPLFASGQGAAVDVIYTYHELVDWVAYGDLPDGRDSRFTKEYYSSITSGGFDSFGVHAWGPVSEMGPAEHYWATAVRTATEKWDIEIPWLCAKCGHEVCGTDESTCAPHFTGYRGNGGIGVFMEGGLCDECFDAGCCDVCRHGGGNDEEMYDCDVADHGASLCEWHTETLLDDAIKAPRGVAEMLDELDRNTPLELEPVLLNAGQVALPGIKPEPEKAYRLFRRVPLEGPKDEYGVDWTLQPIEGVVIDGEAIEDRAHEMDLEMHLEPKVVELPNGTCYLEPGWTRGLTLLAGNISRMVEEIEEG